MPIPRKNLQGEKKKTATTTIMNVVFTTAPSAAYSLYTTKQHRQTEPLHSSFLRYASLRHNSRQFSVLKRRRDDRRCSVISCLPSYSSSPSDSAYSIPKTKLFVSGLSFRTTEESLRNAFQNFGRLVEVNLVMDKIAQRPKGFAFIRYATEEESEKAIEGMHGKFLDGRVIFVEVAKPRSEPRQRQKNNQSQY